MNKKKIKIVFMGTPQFSADILRGIIDDGYDVVGVITEIDKPVGRKQELVSPPVKALAEKHGIPVYQPATKEELKIKNQELDYDLGIVAAYGRILPKEILEKPRYGCINFHTSLLPKLRGASPIQTAILEGLPRTGVSIMLLDEGMDTGPILSQVETVIDLRDTTTTLREKMLECGLPLLLNTIPGYVEGEIEPRPQSGDPTYCKMIEKQDGHIDFSKSAQDEERKVRAFNEWPGAFCFWEDKRIKFIDVELGMNQESGIKNQEPGEVFLGNDKELYIKFQDGIWAINRLQIEGKNIMNAKDFLNGHGDIAGAILK